MQIECDSQTSRHKITWHFDMPLKQSINQTRPNLNNHRNDNKKLTTIKIKEILVKNY